MTWQLNLAHFVHGLHLACHKVRQMLQASQPGLGLMPLLVTLQAGEPPATWASTCPDDRAPERT